MSKKFILASCTMGKIEGKPLNSFLTDLYDGEVKIFENNRDGLGKCYNRIITEENRGKYAILCHDDIIIYDFYWKSKLEQLFDKGFSVIGMAGSRIVKMVKPTLWHLMYDKNRPLFSGSVIHPAGDDKEATTFFGPVPQPVVLLDGLFLVVNISDLLDKNIRFDEQFEFHHYDLDFSLQCHNAGLRLSTCGICLRHESPGLRSFEDKKWNASQDLFCKKYNIN